MIASAKNRVKPFDSVLVWKLSRFARNREDSVIYKSLLKSRNISELSGMLPKTLELTPRFLYNLTHNDREISRGQARVSERV